MTLHLRIDRLVLEGPALGPRGGARLEVALAQELGTILAQRGLAPALAQGMAVPRLPVTSMALEPGPEGLGRQLANNLAGTLAGRERP